MATHLAPNTCHSLRHQYDLSQCETEREWAYAELELATRAVVVADHSETQEVILSATRLTCAGHHMHYTRRPKAREAINNTQVHPRLGERIGD
jgi:hypothetical protein